MDYIKAVRTMRTEMNVHPAKTVVKFLNEKQIFDLVYHAASDALDRDGAPSAGSVTFSTQPGNLPFIRRFA